MISPVVERRILLTVIAVCLLLSGIGPKDRLTWLLEVLPILIGAPILMQTAATFPLTPLLYRLLAVHAMILIVGGHYTYAEVPVGRWIQEAFGSARNHYDRLGHFIQGFVPAIVMRELLLKTSPMRPGRWLFFVVCSACLAFSAFYELFEWVAALTLGQSAKEFLGTQGDQWDTQWDMFMALVGAITAQAFLGATHNRQLLSQSSHGILPT